MHRGLGLDIGTDAVKLVELTQRGSGLVVTKAVHVLLPHGASGTAEVEQEALKEVLAQLVREHHLAHAEVATGISGAMAFVRPIAPLLTKRQQLEQAVRFEAQHTIPFKLEEVMWDYQLLSRHRVTNPEVLLGGVKRQWVEQALALLAQARLRPALIDLTPLAAYNAAASQYPPAAAPQAVLNIGRHNTDLVVYRLQHLWVRSFPFGGEQLTHVLQERWQLSRDEAEVTKLGGLDRYTPDERWQALQAPLQELCDELRRSVEYYYAQYPSEVGAAPQPLQRLLLCGGSAQVERLPEYLHEQLGCDVALLDPFASFAVGAPARPDAQPSARASFAVATGLALRHLGRGGIAMDMLREVKQRRQSFTRARLMLMVSGAAGLIILGSYVWAILQDYAGKRAFVHQLDELVRVYEGHQPQVKALMAQAEQREQDMTVLHALVRDRGLWLEWIAVLERLMPPTMWLTALSTTSTASSGAASAAAPATLMTATTQQVVISGRALSFEAVNQLVYQLRSSPWVMDVKPLASAIKKDAATGEEQVEFSIQCRPAVPPRTGMTSQGTDVHAQNTTQDAAQDH